MKKVWQTVLALTVGFAVLGCSLVNQVQKQLDKTQPPQVIVSTDGKAQITVPSSWLKEPDLNELATIQAASRIGEMYVVVIPQSKADFDDQMTIDEIVELARTEINGNLTEPKLGVTTPAVINGYPARQFDISGGVQGIKVKYLCALVDAPESYHLIYTWTLPSRFDVNREQLQTIINSFRENAAGAADAPPPPNS